MTTLPPPSNKELGLVIDLDTCVGCHACAVSCKEWNAGGFAAPLTDEQPYGKEPSGVWFNRVHSYEVAPTSGDDETPAVPTTGTLRRPPRRRPPRHRNAFALRCRHAPRREDAGKSKDGGHGVRPS